jgi:hypothetical protein
MARSKIPGSRRLAAAALLASGGLFIAGCATTRVEAEWTDPQFAGKSLRSAKVLVVCDANEVVIKRICQDQLAAQIAASGATPVMGPADLTVGPPPANDKTIAAARSAGAKAIFGSSVAPDATVVNPPPSVSFGFGGFGFGGGGSTVSGAGVGIGMPVGGGQVNTSYGANVMLTDVATGRLMWTSKVTAPASGDINSQLGSLAKVAVEAAQKAGLF